MTSHSLLFNVESKWLLDSDAKACVEKAFANLGRQDSMEDFCNALYSLRFPTKSPDRNDPFKLRKLARLKLSHNCTLKLLFGSIFSFNVLRIEGLLRLTHAN